MIFCIFARNLRLKTLNMFKRILTLAVVATLAWGAQAKVKLSHLVGDNMVIQQQTDVRLWGWAKPNSSTRGRGMGVRRTVEHGDARQGFRHVSGEGL